MSMSGAVTGMALIAAVRRLIPQVLLLALSVCIVAVAGASVRRTAAVLIAAAACRPAGATTSGSVLPSLQVLSEELEKARKEKLEVVSLYSSEVACGAATSRGMKADNGRKSLHEDPPVGCFLSRGHWDRHY